MNRQQRKAFTLVELLVVISIIALLLAVLMPALQKARQQARTVICSSNFHQVGLVYQIYASDYRALLPRFVDADNGAGMKYDPGYGQSVLSVIPYFIDPEPFDLLVKSYHTQPKFWVCPSLVSNGGKLGFMRTANFKADQLPRHGNPPYPYYLGIARLNGLKNMSLADPDAVAESALTIMDGSTKALAADLNMRWDRDWSNIDTVISHVGNRYKNVGIPLGGVKLQADGSAKWVKPDSMAVNSTPIADRNKGKFCHWKGQGRDYFW